MALRHDCGVNYKGCMELDVKTLRKLAIELIDEERRLLYSDETPPSRDARIEQIEKFLNKRLKALLDDDSE